MKDPVTFTQCERCKKEHRCTFFGRSADVSMGESQSGEWLCDPCVKLRLTEIDAGLAKFREILNKNRG